MKYEYYQLFIIILNEFSREWSMRFREFFEQPGLWDELSKSSITIEGGSGVYRQSSPYQNIAFDSFLSKSSQCLLFVLLLLLLFFIKNEILA